MKKAEYLSTGLLFVCIGLLCLVSDLCRQNQRAGHLDVGLALCIVFLFIGLPLLSISLIRDVLPSLWLSFTSANYESPSISLLYGTIHKMATLDQLYVALAMICILVAIGQSILLLGCFTSVTTAKAWFGH